MPGWQGSSRKATLPKDWRKIREQVLNRDRGKCTWRAGGIKCDRDANQVDHIVPGSDHSLSNLRALCREHHAIKSSSEGGRAKRRVSRYRVARPSEQHPGLI